MPYVIAALLVLLADQMSKYLATIHIPLNTGSVDLIPGLIALRNIHNYGAAFGILKNGRWFFLIITVVLFAAAAYAFSKKLIRSKPARWLAVLVLTGALGNALDRLVFGYVVDMFQFVFLKNFAIFNVADIFITCGTIAFCVFLFLEDTGDDPIPAVGTVKQKASSAVSALRSKLPAKSAEDKAQTPEPAEDNFPVIDDMALDSVADEVTAVFDTIPPVQPSKNKPFFDDPAPVEPPKAEEPAPVEPPKAEEPAPVEPPKAEEPAPVEPPKAEEPAPVEPPKAEEPAPVEPPKAEVDAFFPKEDDDFSLDEAFDEDDDFSDAFFFDDDSSEFTLDDIMAEFSDD